MRINIETNIKNIVADLSKLEKSVVPKALVQALNKTARGAKTDSKREVSKRTGIKQKDITKKITITKATKTRFTAFVKPSSTPFRLAYFKHTTRKRSRKLAGVRAKSWGVNKVYKGSFVGQMKSKGSSTGEAIFVRKKGSKKIRQLYGANVEQTFRRDTDFQRIIIKSINTRFDKEFTRAFNFQKGKLKL